MANKNLTELSNEELLKYEKQLNTINYMLLGASFVLVALGIYSIFTDKKMLFLLIIPGGISAIVFSNQSELKKIKEEKLKRNI